MHVLLVGTTGVLGRATVPRLIDAGHHVTGLARTPEKLLFVDRMGADAVRGDILDAEATRRLLVECRPDAVVNLATAIPLSLKIDAKEWELNDRIRTVGTLNLLRACEAAGVALLVQESVGYVCEPRGAEWIMEDSARTAHPFLQATVEMEDIVRSAPVPSTLLRFGALMSADSWHTQQSIAALRRGMLPIVGKGDGYLSLIHAEDAALAIVRTVDRPEVAAGKTYNVVDDAPATMTEVFPFAAGALGAPMPKSVPPFLARMVVGSLTLDILTASYRMSNAKIRAELEFAPRFPTFQETWTQIAKALKIREIVVSPDVK
jgi:nucleoside-diphosphate-sugar epimerase